MGKQSKYSTLFCTTNSVRQEPRLAFQPVRTAPPRRRAPTRATLPLPFAMGGSGYAGYAPGHKVADLATPLQQYLKAVKSMATLDTLEKLTRNSAQAPAEEKFRKVRPTPRRASSVPPPPSRRRALRHPARPPVPPRVQIRAGFPDLRRNGTVNPRQIHRGRPDLPSPPPPSRLCSDPTDEREDRRAHHRRPRREGGDARDGLGGGGRVPDPPGGQERDHARSARDGPAARVALKKWEEEEFKKRIAARNRARRTGEGASARADGGGSRARRSRSGDAVVRRGAEGESRVQTATQAGCCGSSGG